MNFRIILDRQKETLADLEKQVNALERSNLAIENAELKEKTAQLMEQNAGLILRAEDLKTENTELKNALYEHTFNEKKALVDISEAKMKIYFESVGNEGKNKLAAIEKSIKGRIDMLRDALKQYNADNAHPLWKKLNELASETNTFIKEAQEKIALDEIFTQQDNDAYAELREEQVTGEQIIAVAKKNSWERFVGLNIINTLGILLIIVGTIAAGQFVQGRITPNVQAGLIFVLGVVMVIAGEIMNRRKPNVFSLGVTAGGLAVLYVGLVVSYFVLGVLSMSPALIVCVVVTALAFVLSTRYRSQTLLSIAFVGGYLPLFSITPNPAMVHGAMVYFIILNLLDLIVSFKMKWTISTYIGLFFNIISTGVIISIYTGAPIILLLFVFFAFFNYTVIPLVATYRTKAAFALSDVVLLGINTFVSSVTMYALFWQFGWNDFQGLLAVIFAVVYLGLSAVIWKKFKQSNDLRDLFFITGMVFVVLIVPIQFGVAWLSLGWLLQGLGAAMYGIVKENKRFKVTGLIICALCLAAFLIGDVIIPGESGIPAAHFGLKYLSMTLGSLLLLGAFVYKKHPPAPKAMKYLTLGNIWFFALYTVYRVYGWSYAAIYATNFNANYLIFALVILLTFILGFVIPRIKVIADRGTQSIGNALYSFVVGIFVVLHITERPLVPAMSSALMADAIIGSLMIILAGLMSVFVVYAIARQHFLHLRRDIAYLPVIVSSYFVAILTLVLLVQYNIPFDSMWISFIYVGIALAGIIFGFVKRFMFMRRFGLGLALLSVGKLFLIDITGLTPIQRIVSYFVLGAVLLGISAVYQFFNKRH